MTLTITLPETQLPRLYPDTAVSFPNTGRVHSWENDFCVPTAWTAGGLFHTRVNRFRATATGVEPVSVDTVTMPQSANYSPAGLAWIGPDGQFAVYPRRAPYSSSNLPLTLWHKDAGGKITHQLITSESSNVLPGTTARHQQWYVVWRGSDPWVVGTTLETVMPFRRGVFATQVKTGAPIFHTYIAVTNTSTVRSARALADGRILWFYRSDDETKPFPARFGVAVVIHNPDGTFIQHRVGGGWDVTASIDRSESTVWFVANHEDNSPYYPGGASFYRMPLDGSAPPTLLASGRADNYESWNRFTMNGVPTVGASLLNWRTGGTTANSWAEDYEVPPPRGAGGFTDTFVPRDAIEVPADYVHGNGRRLFMQRGRAFDVNAPVYITIVDWSPPLALAVVARGARVDFA